MCSRLQTHFNMCTTVVADDQKQINAKIKDVEKIVNGQYNKLVEKQKAYTYYAEAFSKVRQISQTLARCNQLLNENIDSITYLNNILPIEHRLEPFVWQTED